MKFSRGAGAETLALFPRVALTDCGGAVKLAGKVGNVGLAETKSLKRRMPEIASTGVMSGRTRIERRDAPFHRHCFSSTFPGFRRWAFACSHSSFASSIKTAAYKPYLFLPEYFR
jgi:hypothetical protein